MPLLAPACGLWGTGTWTGPVKRTCSWWVWRLCGASSASTGTWCHPGSSATTFGHWVSVDSHPCVVDDPSAGHMFCASRGPGRRVSYVGTRCEELCLFSRLHGSKGSLRSPIECVGGGGVTHFVGTPRMANSSLVEPGPPPLSHTHALLRHPCCLGTCVCLVRLYAAQRVVWASRCSSRSALSPRSRTVVVPLWRCSSTPPSMP